MRYDEGGEHEVDDNVVDEGREHKVGIWAIHYIKYNDTLFYNAII
jgi:hypothetical protein